MDDETDLEQLIKQKFRREIRQQVYEFLFASNGSDALTYVQSDPEIDIVLSDINMPVMDGLTLLTELRELRPLIKSVMVSAYGDMANIRTAMNRGAFDFITKPIDFSDLNLTIQRTIRHAAQFRETLKAIKENNILKMYVHENVLSYMGGREFESTIMASETITGTVIFVDICGFTTISEFSSPDMVVKLVNTYFDIMVTEIMAQKGYVDKFIGDAIMAVFKDEYHLNRAVLAALAIRKALDELPQLALELTFKPKVSIGINSGEMTSCNIGSSSLRRLDYTMIGDTVNLASILQDLAGENQIVIDQICYQQVKDAFTCNLLGNVALKNRLSPVTVYEVVEAIRAKN